MGKLRVQQEILPQKNKVEEQLSGVAITASTSNSRMVPRCLLWPPGKLKCYPDPVKLSVHPSKGIGGDFYSPQLFLQSLVLVDKCVIPAFTAENFIMIQTWKTDLFLNAPPHGPAALKQSQGIQMLSICGGQKRMSDSLEFNL